MIFSKKVFYGWIVVICCIILMALGIGMFNSTNSMFVIPVCESLGFSRAQFTFYRSIVILIGALVMPLYGRIIQRFGVKKVLAAGALMLGFSAFGYSTSNNLWQFYLFASVNGLFYNGINFMSIGVLINAWFKGRKGLATGLAFSGSGLGGAVMIPVIGHMIELIGWRWAYRFMGVFGIAVMLPIIIIFIKNEPTDIGLDPLALEQSGQKSRPLTVVSYSFREAIRSLKFWLLVTAFFFLNFFATAINSHTAPYLSDLGYMTPYIASVLSLYMVSLTMGKIFLGSIYDRFGAMAGNVFVSAFCLGFPIFAYLSYIPAMAWIYAVFVGIASCGVTVPVSILVIRYFGDKEFPVIFSFVMMFSNLAPVFSLPAMGAVYDFTGTYKPAWIVFFFCSAIITACFIAVEILGKRDAYYSRSPGAAS